VHRCARAPQIRMRTRYGDLANDHGQFKGADVGECPDQLVLRLLLLIHAQPRCTALPCWHQSSTAARRLVQSAQRLDSPTDATGCRTSKSKTELYRPGNGARRTGQPRATMNDCVRRPPRPVPGSWKAPAAPTSAAMSISLIAMLAGRLPDVRILCFSEL